MEYVHHLPDEKAQLHQIIATLQQQVQNLENEKLELLEHLNFHLQKQVRNGNTQLKTQCQRNQLLADIALRIRASLNLETILQTTVTEVRELLNVERVIIYRFDPNWSGKVTVESVHTPQWSILGRIIKDECFEQNWLQDYQNQFSRAITDIHQAGLSACHIEFLTQFQIKANLVVPILVDNSLWGLLIAHSCQDVRPWQPDEVEFLEQLSIQVSNAIQQATLLEKIQKANAQLEVKVRERTTELQAANQRLRQDINQRQQAEKQLKFQAQLLGQVRDAVVAVDIAHRVIHWNPAAEQHYGIKAEDAIGKPITECYEYLWLKPEDKTKANEALATCGFWQGENIHRKLNGQEIYVESSVSVLKDEQGNNIGMLALIRDITERKQLEIERKKVEQELKLKNLALEEAKRQAETANQAKSEFLANISHEIRTPLNAILGFSDLLQSEVKEPPIASYVKSIASSGRTLLALINDILDLSKIEAGKLELYYEPVDLRGLIQEILQIFSPTAKDKNLLFRSNIDDQVPPAIDIDEVRLRQILFNVVGNALKFTEQGYVQINIRAHLYSTEAEEKVWLEIAVEDTGIGIAREQQQRIFEAFVQSSGKSDRQYGGTGLGLAITKRLINMMGGIITLQSQLGKGSIFTFVFPAVSPASGLPKICPQSSTEYDLNLFTPSTILVVDDVPSNLNLIQAFFQKTHHRVLSVENGKQAINLAKLHQPDLILLDLKMPDMDGKEVAEKLKQDEQTRNIPIVILTASSQPEDKYELEKICQGFLPKPISCMQLVEEFKKHLQIVINVETNTEINSLCSNFETSQLLNNPINLQELLINLQQQEKTLWHSLRTTYKLREIKQFIQVIKTWSQEHQCQLLADYVNNLETNLDAFDMDQVPFILEQFPSIIQAIKALI